MTYSIIILAAGKGTRMGNNAPKVLCKLGEKTLIKHVLDTAKCIQNQSIYLVVGYEAEKVKEETKDYGLTYVMQHDQLGTGHAVIQVAPYLHDNPVHNILILSGDCPLISSETLNAFIENHTKSGSLGSVLSTKLQKPENYGRVLRNDTNAFYAIREAKDCSKKELEVQEINSGIYCFNSKLLFENLKKCNRKNAQGEYYLTDVLENLHKSNHKITAFCTPKSSEILGANTPEELAFLESVMKSNS